MSVRRITNGGRKVIGKFPSLKTGRAVWWESPLERDYVYLLEFDPEVVCYQEQPFRINFVLDREIHRYTPDFLVERASGRKQIVEVKPEDIAKQEEYQRFSKAVSAVCGQHNCEFLTVTDRWIRILPRLDNVKLLHRYARIPILPEHLIECRTFFFECPKPSLGLLVKHLSANALRKQVAYALVSRGVVTVDLDAPLTEDSPVAWPAWGRHAKEAVPG